MQRRTQCTKAAKYGGEITSEGLTSFCLAIAADEAGGDCMSQTWTGNLLLM